MLAGERWCYLMARVLLQQGECDRALMFIGELMQTRSGRPHARRLLAEFHDSAVGPMDHANDPASVPLSVKIAEMNRK